MRSNFLNINKIILSIAALALMGCTNLDEKVIDEVLGSEVADPEAALAAAYSQLGEGTFVDHGSVFALQEYSTDEAILPTRGSDWGDGGKWRAMHEFTWDANSDVVKTTWNQLNFGITKSLTAISSANKSTGANKALFLAEAKGLLAYYTYTTIDLFGQAPYRDPDNINAPIVIRKADTTIDALITEVTGLIPNLADIKTQNTHAGRFTKQAAYALLADMYLNRAVLKNKTAGTFNFTEQAVNGGGNDMDKVIEYCNLLINNPNFSLESNYFHNFDINNDTSKEMIFTIVQKKIASSDKGSDNDLAYMSMERSQKPSPDNRGTNASCVTPEFYYSWNGNHDDPRFQRTYQYEDGTWFRNDGTDVSVPSTSKVEGTGKPWFHFNRGLQVGQQYGPKILQNGNFDMTADGRIKVFKLFTEKNTTLAADFTPELNFDNPSEAVFTQAQINRGVRNFKFEFDPGYGNNGTSGMDVPLYRLGTIYMMRAEAYFRNGNIAAALADVNKLRTSRTRESLYNNAPGVAIASLDANTLFKESGYELYWEMYRRKAMIRFGKFDLPGTAKSASQPYRRIFPIPQATLDASNDFTQNPGY
ncbi:RagB/SusD family nutrient uptake outer membrane protein [Chryseobacterium sp. CKR4-1]|uniref:RagB/SusD family nutrient uptake outer membrane protein n=1 Tax=Chryseobacterium sp. CKR4-1 TaxID=3068896 RepID=UPI0027967D1D|nr:RagB/SusD family nutrient uptake outer membrane protein [Chryseobacterium sp. CKR4-1]MDQ1804407.1 RagB/SusD family nutrient uptake outer membrane protein [Chryseobacterium sp. CKR4-1]WBV55115.1 RagB/SusD family nutrient uptake outer membrane protein [Chryseobacterium daecheongense]